MLFPIIKSNPPILEKKASLTGMLLGLGVGELGMMAAAKFGKNRGANFLQTGIELGKKGEKMAPFTETVSRNILGNRQVAPYDAGMRIGNKISQKGMAPEKEQRFIDRVVQMNVNKKEKLEAAGEKVTDPVLRAMDDYQIGKDRKHPIFQKMINEGSIPQERSGIGGAIAGNALSGIAAPLGDFRFAARPLVRKAENVPTVQSTTEKLFPAGTKRGKVGETVRNYID